MNIHVGNVPYAATEEDLKALFSEYGPVATATIIRDRYDGRSKGFGFVEMENQEDGERAIEALDGQKMMGRPLKVNPARPRPNRGPSRERREPQQRDHSRGSSSPESKSASDGTFHNPYTFVPSPPRDKIKYGEFAGDFNPLDKALNHSTFQDELWTGHIPIKLTAVTPLVLLDREDDSGDASNGHQVHPVLDYIPESSLRGMLRSAYEVVTNSRYACFNNPNKLTYRVDRQKLKYDKSPEELLHASLKSAKLRSELSPADRLFGWVLQNGNQETETGDENKRGYKSRIRVVCDKSVQSDIVEDFSDNPLSLTILGRPKPEQARFYVAKDPEGNPQKDGIPKSKAGYAEGKGLRGRKHYWHHSENDPNYWNPSAKSRNKEYIRIGELDNQNRSIKGWIKPEVEFEVSLYVQNLQHEEVGALLWLLTLNNELSDADAKHYFRLGYGKPLGFGSVRMEIDDTRLVNGCIPLGSGKDWKKYYADINLCSPATLDVNKQHQFIQSFQSSVKNAYNEQDFDKLSFIEGFKQVLKGPDTNHPIHYPRRKDRPDPKGKNYEWFMDNENGRKPNQDGMKIALPKVTNDKGLPYNPSKQRQRGGGR